MKRFLLALIVVATLTAAPTASAQEWEEPPLRWSGFETNRFWDNWEVAAAGGGSFLLLSDGKLGSDPGKFFDRVGWNANIAFTKWLVPIVGMRLQLDGGEFRNYSFHPEQYGEQIFKTPYLFVHGDIMLNLSNWIGGYDPSRVYSAISYAGFGYTAMSWTDKSAGGYNGEYAFTSGFLSKFRITPQWDIELDLRSWIFPEKSLPAEIRSGDRFAFALSASLGVAYRFNSRDWTPAYSQYDVDGYIAAIVGLEEQLIASNEMLAAVGNRASALNSENERLRGELQASRNRTQAAESATTTSTEAVVFFNIGEATLSPYAKATLDQYIEQTSDKSVTIVVTGYADKETGSAARNETLSRERAEVVRSYLIDGGIAASRITTRWVGDTEMAFVSPDTPVVNRCVIIK